MLACLCKVCRNVKMFALYISLTLVHSYSRLPVKSIQDPSNEVAAYSLSLV